MWLRTIIVFITGLLLGLLGTLLHRGTASNTAEMALTIESLPAVSVDEVRLNDVPFNKAIDYLAGKSHVPIFLNRKALEAAGIDLETPISLNLPRVSLAAALDAVLMQAGGITKLSYVMVNGVVTVSTADVVDQSVIVRVYDVKDLLDTAAAAPKYAPSTIQAMGGFGGGGVLYSADLTKDIIHLIEDQVAPDTWRDAGGTIGSATVWADRELVIVTTPKIQDQVAQFLVDLRNPRPPSALPAFASTQPAPALLDRELGDVNLQGLTFARAIDRLQTLSHAPITVNWPTVSSLLAVGPGNAINLHEHRRTLGQMLREISLNLGGKSDLAFWEDGEMVYVSTGDSSPEFTEVCVYDVGDLLSSQGAAQSPNGVNPLIQAIQDTIAPSTWQDAGGGLGSCKMFGGELVVSATPKIQAAVADLLMKLRNPKKGQAK